MKLATTGFVVAALLAMAIPLQAQNGWGVDRYEGFRASVNNKGNVSQITWVTGNLGNAWDEGEWVPYCLTLKNVDMTVGSANFSDIKISYDFTKGNPAARFVDLVRGIQVGTSNSLYFPLGVGSTSSYGWPAPPDPHPLNGAPCPLTSALELSAAQNCQDANVWGGTRAGAWKLLNLPNAQMNRDLTTTPLQYGSIGTETESFRCFTITYDDLRNAGGTVGGGVPANYQGDLQIYFCLHLSQTFIWSLSLQSQLNTSPTDDWGGYLYANPPFSNDSRDGSGFVPGSSGHTTLVGPGSRTVSIPIPPAPIGQISGLKFYDANADGIQNGSEPVLEGWEIYITTNVGGTPVYYTRVTDNTGAYSLSGLPGGAYVVSEQYQGPTPTSAPPPNYPYAAFGQSPPSTWDESFPTTSSSINSGTVLGMPTSAAGIALGYAPVSWGVDLIATNVQGGINFGNFVPPPQCSVTASVDEVCNDGSPVTITAARIAEGTPPYTVAWSYSGPQGSSWTPPNNTTFSFDFDPLGQPPGFYTFQAILTDANGLSTPAPYCDVTIEVLPLPTISASASPTAICFGYSSTLTATSNASSPSFVWTPGNLTGPSITVSPTTTTTYTVTVTDDATDCDNSTTVDVTVNPLPACSITPLDAVCPSATTVHSAPAGMQEYLWGITGDGSIIGANNQQTVTVDAAMACSGSYTLSLYIKDQNGCENNCSETITVGDSEAPSLTGTLPGGPQGNVCMSNAPGAPSISTIAAQYTDNCGNITVVLTNSSVTGDDCSWTAEYTYTVRDDCQNFVTPNPVVTYTGGDTEAPTLSGTLPGGDLGNACLSAAPAAPTEASIAALYTDNCGTVTATLTNSSVTGTDCDWTAEYTYSVQDQCQNSVPAVVTYTGGDDEAPSFVGPNPGYDLGNACLSAAPAAPTEASIAALYTDNCGIVTATLLSADVTGTDCDWQARYEYKVEDECQNFASNLVVIYTGGDTEAPSPIAQLPGGPVGNYCKGAYPVPTEASIAALYTDNCGIVTATLLTSNVTGTDCNWTAVYTYTIQDECQNFASPAVVTFTGGDTEAPSLTGTLPGGPMGNLCKSNATPAPAEALIAAQYTDNCGIVTATLINSDVSGTDCAWTATYTYTVEDECQNLVSPNPVIVFTGGDTEAPSLTGTLPGG
ncbi:hypothetical protein KQI65_06800, partial [bacterium]|nr:hypothetical protein [bacterium]